MAWTAVHTFAVGDVLAASDLNTWLSNNTQFLFQPPSVQCTHNADQTASTGSTLLLSFNTERWKNTDTGMHSTSVSNSRLIAVTAGQYLVMADASWGVNATGIRELLVTKNGSGTSEIVDGRPAAPAANQTMSTLAHQVRLAATEWVTLGAFQDSGGNLAVQGIANYSPLFGMCWLSG